MAEQITAIQPAAGLPADFQRQLAELLRKRQLAQMFQSQAMGRMNQPTQFTGGKYSYAVPQSPLGGIANALTMALGNKQLADADQGVADVNARASAAKQEEIRRMQALPQETAFKLGEISEFPDVRKLAETMRKEFQSRLEKGAGIVGTNDPRAGVEMLTGGQFPQGGYQPPKPVPPSFGETKDSTGRVIPYVINTNERGVQSASGIGGQTISNEVKIGSREAEMALDETKRDLKARQERAQAAKETLSSNTTALEAINRGAQSGGLEEIKQGIRKALQGFGIETEANTPTQELSMALGNAVLAKARALAPVTAEDVNRLREILGSINTDPQALQKMLSVYNGIAVKELQDYNRYVQRQQGNLQTPYAQGLFGAADIGYEQQPPPGSTLQQLMAIQELKKRGGDVSQFAVGGEQIPPDAQFQLGAGSRPGGRPAPQAGPKPIESMTPQEKQEEILRLKKLLGIP